MAPSTLGFLKLIQGKTKVAKDAADVLLDLMVQIEFAKFQNAINNQVRNASK